MPEQLEPYQWVPGKSGNPTGRPKLGTALAEKVRKATRDGGSLIRLLTDIAGGHLPEAKVSDRLAAADILLNRGWGKAIQQVDMDVDVNITHHLDAFTTQQLRDLLSLQQEVKGEEQQVVESTGIVVS